MHGLQERFWEGLYPEIDDGDLEPRAGPLRVPEPGEAAPVPDPEHPADGRLRRGAVLVPPLPGVAGHRQRGRKDPEQACGPDRRGQDHLRAVRRGGGPVAPPLLRRLVEDLRECAAAFTELDQGNDRHFGRDAPSLVNVRKALDDCRKLLEPILNTKRQQEPDRDGRGPEPAAEEAPAAEETWAAEPAEERPRKARRPRRGARRPGPAPSPGPSAGGPIADAEDAQQRILEAAAYLRQNEPGSPVPYLVVRALRMGEVYGLPRPLEASELASPSSEVRQALRRLAAEEQWADLLEEAEQALGRPEGRAWLDAQRLAVPAAGRRREAPAAAEAARGLLRAVLADFPDLPQAELSDGTPAANAETRAWLEAEILAARRGRRRRRRTTSPSPPPPPIEAPAPPEASRRRRGPARCLGPGAGRPCRTAGWPRGCRSCSGAGPGRDRPGAVPPQPPAGRALPDGPPAPAGAAPGRGPGPPGRRAPPGAVGRPRADRPGLGRPLPLPARRWAGDGAADRLPPVFARLCRLDIGQALRSGGGDGSLP